MAKDDDEIGKPAPGSPQTIISGNTNSGFIAGGDIRGGRGGINLGNVPLPRAGGSAPLPAAPAQAAAPAVRILFLGASPQGVPPLRLDQEIRAIDLALHQAEFRDRFDLRQHHAVRSSDLQAVLLRHRPQIVHFSGHGMPDGLYLEDEQGRRRKVEGSVLARILAVFKKQIRCVVLNACYSRDQAEAIAKDIDCVIGMSTALGDRTAARFAASFYQALACGSSVEEAFNLACAQIDMDDSETADAPQLIAFRKDPGEVIFAAAEPPHTPS
jgi:hypothetical protein